MIRNWGAQCQFSISFDAAASPDFASLSAAEQQAVLDTANAAAAIWSRYLTLANITLDLQIRVDNSLFGSDTLAQGRPGNFVATGRTFNGQPVFDTGSSLKLQTGQDSNGAQGDLVIDLTVDSIRAMLFKSDEYATVPAGQVDALSVFLREIAHGLGMYSLAQQPGAPGVSVYDTFVHNSAITGMPVFIGYNGAMEIGWGLTGVPLDPGNLADIDETGVNEGGRSIAADLMTTVLSTGTNVHISRLDLGILQDIGVPVASPTQGDDVVFGLDGQDLDLQGGNDTAYAVPGGSILYGEAGNDRLIGNIGNDTLAGAADDDYLEGGGGNDTLDGGTGFDIAHYSGLASDYLVTQRSDSTVDVRDLRPNSPDGTDRLSYIEELQWGDGSVTPLNTPPVLTAQPVSIHSDKTLALSSLFSVSDADGDAMTGYLVVEEVNSNDPQRGFFSVDGVRYSTVGPLYLTAAQMASATYTTGTRPTTTLSIKAIDGIAWSNEAKPAITLVPDNPPVVTTTNISAGHNQTLAASDLFTVSDADSDIISNYQLWDATNDPNSGHFVINGVAQAARTVIDITAAQLAQTSFVTGTVGDNLVQIRAFDGLAWSQAFDVRWSPFDISILPNTAPVLTTADKSATHGQIFALSDLFSVSDTDGDTITKYKLWDGTDDPNSGYFVINGVAQPQRAVIDIIAAQVAQTSFVAGYASDSLVQIRAFDGTDWSQTDAVRWAPFTIAVPANHAPVLATTDKPATHGQTFSLSSLFSVSDADGDAITRYQLWDGTDDPNSGHFVINGVAQPQRAVIDITAAQVAQTSFVAGSASDSLVQIRAFDGVDWSQTDAVRWAPFNITVPANHAPVLTTADKSATHGQTFSLSSLFSVSDADGDTITRYQLWDGTDDPNSGHFVINGVAQPQRALIDITAAQVAQTSFVAGSVSDNLVQIRAFDGADWSQTDSVRWAPFTIAVPANHAPVLTTTDKSLTHGQSVALSSLFSVSDADGDAITAYQIWDATADPLSGHFVINGAAQPERAVIDLTPGQIGQTSFLVGTHDDDLQVRAFDGFAWSQAFDVRWSPFHVAAG